MSNLPENIAAKFPDIANMLDALTALDYDHGGVIDEVDIYTKVEEDDPTLPLALTRTLMAACDLDRTTQTPSPLQRIDSEDPRFLNQQLTGHKISRTQATYNQHMASLFQKELGDLLQTGLKGATDEERTIIKEAFSDTAPQQIEIAGLNPCRILEESQAPIPPLNTGVAAPTHKSAQHR